LKHILFLHDTSLSLKRGAELSINQLVQLGKQKKYHINVDLLEDFTTAQSNILATDLTILCSTTRCRFEASLFNFLWQHNIPYVKIEYDYNFCIRRNVLCTLTPKIKNCCDVKKFHKYRKLFKNSLHNFFQSPKHYEIHYDFYGEALKNYTLLPPSVDVENIINQVDRNEKNIPFFGDLSYIKGGYELIAYAEKHPDKNFQVYGNQRIEAELPNNISFLPMVENKEALQILGRSKYVFIKPVWPEPSGRLAAEAFLSGCELITNDKVGTFSFDFYPDDTERAKKEMAETPELFYSTIENVFKPKKTKKGLGNVLIYKSYAGLGDLFFSLAAIKLLEKESDSLYLALKENWAKFIKTKFPTIQVITEAEGKKIEDQFDHICDLGNYPAFKGDDIPHAIKYITHKKVKQHSIAHYQDAVARLHPAIEPHQTKYPYFKRKTNHQQPYYTIHPGAGFLLKTWPVESYAQLIDLIYKYFPELTCHIIIGPEDPNPEKLLQNPVQLKKITGDLVEVGKALEGALFHIGNDAGITHFAGAYNLPIVAIYGPTGPGSWGPFSDKSKVIWGKKGVCDLKCNYEVILNCSHKICLNSITPNRVFAQVLKLFNLLEELDFSDKLIFDPHLEIVIEKNNAIILKNEQEELLLEFNNSHVLDDFLSLSHQSFEFSKVESSELEPIINLLIQKEIILQLPKF